MKHDSVRAWSLYECVSEGSLLSIEKFRLYFIFSSCLCITHIKIHKCFVYSGNQGNTVSLLFISAACFVYSGNQGNTVSLLFISAALLCLQR